MRNDAAFTIRALRADEAHYLRRAVYLSIHVAGGGPPPPGIVKEPVFRRTWESWGRHGDIAVVAAEDRAPESRSNRVVGAAWARLYTADEATYGYVAPNIPALAIAVELELRGAGIGTRLMHELVRRVREAGFSGLSLSVDPDNRAIGLYRRLGFRETDAPRLIADDRNPVMFLDLREGSS